MDELEFVKSTKLCLVNKNGIDLVSNGLGSKLCKTWLQRSNFSQFYRVLHTKVLNFSPSPLGSDRNQRRNLSSKKSNPLCKIVFIARKLVQI